MNKHVTKPRGANKTVEHPRFDKVHFEVAFDPKKDVESPLFQVFSTQGRALLQRIAASVMRREEKVISGEQLREIIEHDRDKHFPDSKQKEIFRIFQDYRARFVRAGFIRIVEAED